MNPSFSKFQKKAGVVLDKYSDNVYTSIVKVLVYDLY